MKRTVSKGEFRDAFRDYGRDDQFSSEGLGALYDWLEELEEETGEEMELDVVGLCCDFSEHKSALDAINDLGYDFIPEGIDEEEREESARDWLRGETTLIPFDGGVIVQGF